MAENPFVQEELEAQLFESLGKAPAGLVLMRQSGEWFIGTAVGFVTGATLAECVQKAQHRGFLE